MLDITKAQPRTLYVYRNVLNAQDIISWAKSQGFDKVVPPEEMHVTIAYSKTPVDWIKMGSNQNTYPGSPFRVDGTLTIMPGGPRVVEPLGPDAIVLMFASPDLAYRNEDIRNKGASWDWPGFQPHITLTYNGVPKGLDLDEVEPYQGVIELGPETFEEITPNATDGIVEKLDMTDHSITLDVPLFIRLLEYAREDSPKGLPGDLSLHELTERAIDLQNKGEDCLSMDRYKDIVGDAGMKKIGARHTKQEYDQLQSIHDQCVALGAKCEGQGTHNLEDLEENPEGQNVDVIKVDSNLGLVFGWAIVCKRDGEDYYDLNRDSSGERVPEHIPEQSMLEASSDFMENSRLAKEMHVGDGKGSIVFAFPLTTDIAKAMGINTRTTGLMIAMKPSTPELLSKYENGVYKGFSIGGKKLNFEDIEMNKSVSDFDIDTLLKTLGADAKASDFIHDFVHSDNKRFKGKSKA